MKLTIVGLGPRDPGLLTVDAHACLNSAEEVYARTPGHPALSIVPPSRVHALGSGPIHSDGDTREEIAAEILQLALRPQGAVYATAGHPLIDDVLVPFLRQRATERGVEVHIISGVSLLDSIASSTAVDVDMRTFSGLVAIVAQLRDPETGCPWDRKQTHESLKAGFLQEAYEVIAALDEGNPTMMQEEFGDILLHILMQSQIAAEANEFTVHDVIQGLSSKLIRRHPHVFGSESVADADEVVANWDAIKRAERGADQLTLASVTPNQPALAYAQELVRRAARAGFDWSSDEQSIDKIAEEVREFAVATSEVEQREEFGDALLAMVNVARRFDIDAEEALRLASRKFHRRFNTMETLAREQALPFEEMSTDELLTLWQEAKSAAG